MSEADSSELTVLSYLCAHPPLWSKCARIIKPIYFDPRYQRTVRFIQQFEADYQKLPSAAIVRGETGIALEEPADAADPQIGIFICDWMEEFCRARAAEDFLIEASEIIEKDRSRETMTGLVTRMTDISQITIIQDLGFEIHANIGNILRQSKAMDGLPTGLGVLDRALGGGVTLPSLNLVTADSGKGKSIFLQNMAVNYVRMGVNVIYYTLELDPLILTKRFAAMMAQMDIDTIYEHIDEADHAIRSTRRSDGQLWIRKYPMNGTTVAHFRSHHHDLTEVTGENFQVICVDYQDLVYPMQQVRLDQIHMKDKYVSEELNDFAHDPSCPKILWTASQQTKTAEEEKEARKSKVAGGKSKIDTCDNALTLKQTEEDKAEDIVWGHIIKARSSGGTGRIFPILWDHQTQRMTDGPDDIVHPLAALTHSRIERDPLMREKSTNAILNKPESQKESISVTAERIRQTLKPSEPTE